MRGLKHISLGLGLCGLLGCNAILGNEQGILAEGSGGAGGSATGGDGGMGGGTVECSEASDCPGSEDTCQMRACSMSNVCTFSYAQEGVDVLPNEPGDCLKKICDGEGATVTTPDDLDADDGNDCTVDTCGVDGPTNTPMGEGEPCSDPADGVCDDGGNCVQCNVEMDCTGGLICQLHQCVPAECGNDIQDQGETDVDCAGPCARCPDDAACVANSDCQSGQCINLKCAVPSCTDGVENGDETDVDCGGPTCPGSCKFGQGCSDNAHCLGGACSGTTCTASCTDLEKNGTETDVDCGGNCSACDVGDDCAINGDCDSGFCYQAGKVCDFSHCNSGSKDSGETDIDCGGPCQKGCAWGKDCDSASDCSGSLLCGLVTGTCGGL